MVRRIGYKTRCWDRFRLPILSLILMGLLGYIRSTRQRKLMIRHSNTPQADENRDEQERRDADRCLEHDLREDVRRYEDDLRELAKT